MNESKANPNRRAARVLIVDDHPAVREALAMRIAQQSDLEVCGEADDAGAALHLVADLKPDIAVIDISLKTGNGIDLIKRIKNHNDSVRLLVWSMHSEALYAERALRAGAMGYITKEEATEQIIIAIRRVLDGKIFLNESVAEQLLYRAVHKGEPGIQRSPLENLSDREMEVFQHIGRGLETQQIAEKLHVSPKTVETYRARIKEKLNLTSATELVRRALQWELGRG
jgi:DNA-binding NarL/FixJ family response regulator